jgi:peptide/nickel transport system substrate-binding protein
VAAAAPAAAPAHAMNPSPTFCLTRPGPAKPWRAWLALACAASALVAACEPRTRRTPDDTLVVVIPDVIRDVDPRFAFTNHDTKVSRIIYMGLTSVDTPSLEPKLALAESIAPVADLVWEVTLRADARFSDGTPVTAADVVYTFSSTMHPEARSLFRKNFEERFERLEVVDERRLRIHLVKPVATLESDLDFGIVKRPEDGSLISTERPIGAGPFRVVSYADTRIVLEGNPHFFGDQPRMDRVELVTVRDTNARALMLVGGSADFTQNAVRVDLVGHVADRDRVDVMRGESAILTYLMMHNQDPALSDVRVRRAIAHAIDRTRIIEAKLGGLAVPATGLLPPMHWAYNPEVPRYDYDPDRSRELLDAAGFPEGPGGAPRLRLTYKTSADQFRLAMARIIASQLGEIGIEVDVRSFEFGTFFEDIKRGNYQIASMQSAEITEPDWYFTYFHSSRIPTSEDPHTHNRWRYRNARVDDLTARGREEMNREERRVLYAEVQEILAREVPVVPLWHEDNVAVMNTDVSGYVLLPNARYFGLALVEKAER